MLMLLAIVVAVAAGTAQQSAVQADYRQACKGSSGPGNSHNGKCLLLTPAVYTPTPHP